jgi:hypothetical protein
MTSNEAASGRDTESQELSGSPRPHFTPLPNWLAGQASHLEIAVLWVLQLHYPRIRPSTQRIADTIGLHRSTVIKVLNDMERKGWVKRLPRASRDGRTLPNSYELRIWPTDEQMAASIGTNQLRPPRGRSKRTPAAAVIDPASPESVQGDEVGVVQDDTRKHWGLGVAENDTGVAQDDTGVAENDTRKHRASDENPVEPGVVLNDGGGSSKTTGSRSRNKKIKEEEIQEVSASQASGDHAQPSDGRCLDQDQPPDPPANAPRFRPTGELIPAALLPVEREILGFWPKKGGGKNQRAWSFLMGQLEQIRTHPAGGTEVVRAQLLLGVKAWEAGKPWSSVRFDNWLRYGPATHQARGRPLPGQTTTGGDLVAEMAALFGEPPPPHHP